MIVELIGTLSITLCALLVGVYWGPWLALSRTMAALSPEVFLPVAKQMNRNLANPMTVLTPVSVLSVIPVAILLFGHPLGFWLAVASFVLLFVTLVVSVAIEVPAVKTMVSWEVGTMPADWTMYRDKWVRFHLGRVLPGIAGLLCLTAALVFGKSQ